LSVYYAAATGDRLSHGPGASVGARWGRDGRGLGLALTGQFRFPRELETESVRVSEASVPLSGRGELDVPLGAGASFYSEVGAGLELVSLTPLRAVGDVEPRAAHWDYRPFGVVGLGPGFSWGNVGMALRGELQVFALDTHFAIATSAGERRELTLARFRPEAVLELRWLEGE
jgi:hypothetical protein